VSEEVTLWRGESLPGGDRIRQRPPFHRSVRWLGWWAGRVQRSSGGSGAQEGTARANVWP